MKANPLRDLSLAFAAGCVGGLINSLALWLAGTAGLTLALGVKLAPSLTPAWLYPRLVWGGLWGLLFLLPSSFRSLGRRSLLYSLAPSVVQLLVVFPLKGQGLGGLQLGALTPAVVLVVNAVWGLATAAWLRRIQVKSTSRR